MTTIDVTERPTERPNDIEPPAPRQWVFNLVIVVGYLACGLAAFWPVLPWTSDRLFGTASDSVLAMWFLAWVPHALAHGLNPFFSDAILAPHGVDLAQNTESPFLGLLTTPLALFLGPIARANVMMILAMPLSATSAFVVLRRWGVWRVAAAIGGLLYGFSPYAVGQSLGHLVLVFTPIPPLIALTMVSILRRQGSPLRLGIQLGLLVTAQFLTEPEVMTSVAIVTGWAVLCAAIRYRSQVRDAWRAVLASLALAGGLAGVLLAYPIWMMFAGPQHYTGTAQAVNNPYYNDVWSMIAPGPLQRLSVGVHFAGVPLSNASEAGGYIGIPLLIAAAILAWRSRRSPRMQLAVVVWIGAVVLSFGPHLWVDGHHTGIPLPFLVIQHLPFLDNLLPVRISMESAACMGAIIAFGLDDVRTASMRYHAHRTRTGRSRGTVSVVMAMVVLAILVITQFPQWPIASQPALGLPAAASDAIPPGHPVTISYPIASPLYAKPMVWQVDAGFRFRLVGGYAEHPDPSGKPIGTPDQMVPGGLDLFLYGQEADNPYLPPVPITPGLIAVARVVAADNDVRLLLVDRGAHGAQGVVTVFTEAFGPPVVITPTLALWASKSGPL
jgi:hypothetical protein